MTAPTLDTKQIALAAPARRSSTVSRTLRNPLGLVCAVVLTLLVLVGVLAPWLAPFDPNYIRVDLTNAPPLSTEYLLGGDSAGRDVLSRLIWGARGTLLACVVVLAVSVSVGVTSGLLAGFFGGKLEWISSWLADAIMALPGVVLLIALYTVIGPSIIISMAIFGLLIAPSFYRLVRGIVRGVRHELYVDAAQVAGLSNARIIFRHILGAVRGPVIIASSFILGAGITIQASLEFLGLGSSGEASWGGMLQLAFRSIYNNPQSVVFPAVIIVVTILSLVLLGNVLRDTMQASHTRPVSRRHRSELEAGAYSESLPEETGGELLEVRGLEVAYPQADELNRVVSGVDLIVRKGEIHGLVGESGSGKSQTAFAILGLLPKEAVVIGGAISFEGQGLLKNATLMKAVRGRRIAYIPQEPMTNLDPTFTIGEQLSYGLCAVRRISKAEARKKLLGLLTRVGIRNAPEIWNRYPHEISGGMAQRVLITGAIASDPDLIIADEPTTALDVTVQADVLQLLRELRDERGLGMILVTHNLGVVADLCDTISVMKDGKIVETADVLTLFSTPTHPYTRELLSSTVEQGGVR
ncbi:peptide/nickel transport system permease protein [Paenarthrobacter nitroguajacolicus]|uniref:dipeptide/oligopeptide/nickel ABC transporter permease/ATP-binding protein n=1 Tax=Paenarthrobacter nitroguajacolicus TaxID=211146 RepID=UPI00286306D9|nr:dipeptide/oligopeptide/nickel ABC transporter permease/ATP-binding protein [Paenarthrobacter nitroguajacolicus]MDR6989192.1 peptide/nickel transport system permease protein [Paenarthrobacter nitroguajacolicus]